MTHKVSANCTIGRISIVIPVLNEERFLPSCLESLRKQDYHGEFEIIVADNGSTDKSASIARDYGTKVVPCPEHKNVFYARQVGADAATGDIIVQADADTLYPPDWLKKIAAHFISHPEAVAVAGRFMYRDPPSWARHEYRFRNNLNKISNRIFGRPLTVSGATFAFRRKVFIAANGYRGLSFAPDQYGIAGRLKKFGEIIYDSKIYVFTSSRTVNKPFSQIVEDGLILFFKWLAFLWKCSASSLQQYTAQKRSRRVAALILPIMAILAFIVIYGYFIPVSPVFGKVYYKADSPSAKTIALTFDDGPNDPYTSEVLNILARHDVKGTFFLVGRNVELYPKTAKRILTEGHVVGNHSYSHDANHALTDYGAKDLNLAQTAIFVTLGVSPHLYRPPHGKKTPWELQAVKDAGMIEVTWSVSTPELSGQSAEAIVRDIVNKSDPGEIILLHDGYGTSHDIPRADKSVLLKALPQIIEQLQAKGYEFVTVPELLNVPAYNN